MWKKKPKNLVTSKSGTTKQTPNVAMHKGGIGYLYKTLYNKEMAGFTILPKSLAVIAIWKAITDPQISLVGISVKKTGSAYFSCNSNAVPPL